MAFAAVAAAALKNQLFCLIYEDAPQGEEVSTSTWLQMRPQRAERRPL